MDKDILVIIPAYNEERNIQSVINELLTIYQGIDILVVNDGSSDKTEEIVKRTGVKIVNHPFNLGYGGALQSGFKYAVAAQYKYIIQFDADGQHSPHDIKSIVGRLKEGYDIVIGSRFLNNESASIGIFKRMAIQMFRYIIKKSTKTKITDPSSGLQGLSRRTFAYYSKLGHYPSDYPDADILIHMLISGYKVCEVPANIRDRNHGESMHAGIKPIYYIIKMLVSIIVVLLRGKTSIEVCD